jgi:hypothetical protein
MTLAITGRSGYFHINKTTFNCFIGPLQLAEVANSNISIKLLASRSEVALASLCQQQKPAIAASATLRIQLIFAGYCPGLAFARNQ